MQSDRLERLNMIVITVVMFYALWVQKLLAGVVLVTPAIDQAVAILSSVGFYRLLLASIYRIVGSSEFLLRLYWGRQYLTGLWSYSYRKTKNPNSPVFCGVWRFEQNLFSTRIVGFGLDEKFEQRSSVRSVSDLVEIRGAYEVINDRVDSIDPERHYYSKTTMTFDRPNARLFRRAPTKMRAQTIIYGGALTGDIHSDVFSKHEDATTEDDVIDQLRNRLSAVERT